MAKFGKLETPSLKEAFIHEMLSKIFSGELQPGDRLPSERELSERLGISRSSVNHGIVELESMGFLTITPRKGTVVNDYRKHPTPQSLAAVMSYGSVELDHSLFSDLMATRLLVEGECARLACANMYESTREEMQDLIRSMEQDPTDPADRIYQFHYQLTRASGNSVYSMIYRGFEPVLRTLIRQHYCVRAGDIHKSLQLHQALLDAISAKDEDRAEHCAREIILQGLAVLEQRYETA